MKSNPKVAAIIQARTTSSRLPNKVLMELYKKPMVLRVIERTKKSKTISQIILAIPEGRENDALAYFARENKVECYRGSENDVLSRYYEAAKKYQIETIVRITADCPFIDPRIVDLVVRAHLKSKVDFTANNLKQTFPLGLDLQVFNFKTLEKTFQDASTSFEREHVVPFMHQRPDIFTIKNVEARGKLKRPDINLSVDTKKDYARAVLIYRTFRNKPFFTKDIIKFLDQCPRLT